MCPRHGLFTIWTIGFGRLIVRGLSRLPSPPAMTTACIDRVYAGVMGAAAAAPRRRGLA